MFRRVSKEMVVWWIGARRKTRICVRCIKFLGATYLTLDHCCSFCGYPGELHRYQWFGEKCEDPKGNHTITEHPGGLVQTYLCCQECKDFFARNPLAEPDPPS